MPVPPSPALRESLNAGDVGHIADHEAIADALNNDTASLTADQVIAGATTFTQTVRGQIANVPAPTGVAITDTAAIHAVRDSGVSQLVFQPGQYLVTGLDASVADQEWVIPTGTTIKLANAANAITLTVSGDRARVYGGGKIDANKANQTSVISSGAGVKVTGDDASVEGLWVADAKWYGILGENCDRPKVRWNKVTDSDYIGIFCVTTGVTAMLAPVVAGNLIDRSTLDGTQNLQGGIQMHGDGGDITGARIIGNHITLPSGATTLINWLGIEVKTGTTGAAVTGNTVQGGGIGISVADAAYKASVTGNTVTGASTYGIEVSDSSHSTVTGNTVDGETFGDYGIILNGSAGGSDHVTIGNNTVRHTTQFGISAQNGSSNVAILGNTVLDGGAAGVNIKAPFTVCANNVIDGDGAAGLRAVFIDTVSNVTVVNNTITGYPSGSSVEVFASAGTITDIVIENQTDRPVTTSGGGTVEWSPLNTATSIYLPSTMWTVTAGTPVEGLVGGGRRVAYLFDAAATETVGTSVFIPDGWHTFTATVEWCNAGAGAGNVIWDVNGTIEVAGSNLNAADVVGVTVTAAAGAQDILVVSTTNAGTVTGDRLFPIRLGRRGADGADTLPNDAAFLGLRLVRAS